MARRLRFLRTILLDKLFSIAFSDLFVGESLDSSFYKRTPDSRVTERLPPECANEFEELRAALKNERQQGRFQFRWKGPDRDVPLRVTAYKTSRADPLFVCRRAAVGIEGARLTLIEAGFAEAIVKTLIGQRPRKGLILFMGSMGAGKTTARGAFLRDYMTAHGGVCMALDAPAEVDLDGEHGSGQIFQQDLETEGELVESLRDSLRSSADVISPGEVTRDEVAVAVLALATSGHLVPTTFHADDLAAGLARFNRSVGNRSEAFADALSVAIHLSLEPRNARAPDASHRGTIAPPGRAAPPERRLTVAPLFVTAQNKEQVRSHIRAGSFQQLSSEIERQKRVLMSGGEP